MEFVKNSLFYDQDIQALQVQEIYKGFHNDYLEQTFPKEQLFFDDYSPEQSQLFQMKFSEPVEKIKAEVPDQPARKENNDKESGFSQKELRDLKVWRSQER